MVTVNEFETAGSDTRGEAAFGELGLPLEHYPQLIYFSSVSGNTHRFVRKLCAAAYEHGNSLSVERLPLRTAEDTLLAHRPFVLVLPTYGGTQIKNCVPKQVIKFLNVERNRNLLVGVISAGNTNFGDTYCLAGDIVARKCNVPHLYRFELMGTPEDVEKTREGLEQFWVRQSWKK